MCPKAHLPSRGHLCCYSLLSEILSHLYKRLVFIYECVCVSVCHTPVSMPVGTRGEGIKVPGAGVEVDAGKGDLGPL